MECDCGGIFSGSETCETFCKDSGGNLCHTRCNTCGDDYKRTKDGVVGKFKGFDLDFCTEECKSNFNGRIEVKSTEPQAVVNCSQCNRAMKRPHDSLIMSIIDDSGEKLEVYGCSSECIKLLKENNPELKSDYILLACSTCEKLIPNMPGAEKIAEMKDGHFSKFLIFCDKGCRDIFNSKNKNMGENMTGKLTELEIKAIQERSKTTPGPLSQIGAEFRIKSAPSREMLEKMAKLKSDIEAKAKAPTGPLDMVA